VDSVAAADADAQRALDAAIEVLGEIRRVKSIEKRALKARIETAEVRWQADAIRLLQHAELDLRTAAGVDRFVYVPGEERLSMSLTFAPEAGGGGEPRA
jgi:hypothetical protein